MIEGAAERHPVPEAPDGGDPRAVQVLVTHAIPATPDQRRGTTIWLSYLAASVADPELARILADAKRGQEDAVTRLLAAGMGEREEACRARARHLIALADGLAPRVLIGDLSAADALAMIDDAWVG